MTVESGADGFFSDYQETSVDPGLWLVAAVGAICALLNLLLPCFVTLGGRYERWRSKGEESEREPQKEEAPPTDSGALVACGPDQVTVEGDMMASAPGASGRAVEIQQTESTAEPAQGTPTSYAIEACASSESVPLSVHSASEWEATKGKNAASKNKAASVTSEEWFFSLADKLMLPDRKDRNVPSCSGAASILSSGSEISSLSSLRRPGRRGRFSSRAAMRRLSFGTSVADGDVARSQSRSQTKMIEKNLSAPTWGSGAQASPEKGSVMSKLEHDDVSAQDAVDRYLHSPGRYLLPGSDASGDVDLLCGDRAWWRPVMILGGFDRLVGISDMDRESIELLKLSIPFTLQSLMIGIFDIINLAIIGHMIGTTEANAYITVSVLTELTNTFTYGFMESLGSLLPSAIGAENYKLAGTYLNTALVLFTLGAIPSVIIWGLFTENVTLWFGFDEETAAIAQKYAYMHVVWDWIRGLSQCIHRFLDVVELERYSTVAQLAEHLLTTMGFVIPVALGVLDLPTIGGIQIGLLIFSLVANVTFITMKGWFDEYSEGLVALPFQNIPALKKVLKTSAPLGIAWILTYGEWEVLTIFAAFLGPAEVAAWGFLGYIWNILEFFSDGLADAGEARCSYHLGANDPDLARLTAYKSILMAFMSSVFATSIIFISAEGLVSWVTPDPTLQRLMVELFPLVGIGQIAMTTGLVSWSLVGAQGRYALATTIQFIGSWGLTMPLSALFVYVFRINLQGLTASLVLGYTCSGVVNTYVLMRSKWESIAERVAEENAEDESTSDNSDEGESSAEKSGDASEDPDLMASDNDDVASQVTSSTCPAAKVFGLSRCSLGRMESDSNSEISTFSA